VQALENPSANGKRFIVGTEKAYSFQEMAQILKSNGYDQVSTQLAPNFLLKFMANFNRDLKGLLPFIGNVFNGNVQDTKSTFGWNPINLEKTVLDTAKSVDEALRNEQNKTAS
jgi:dihydroflavonol-4-reductase